MIDKIKQWILETISGGSPVDYDLEVLRKLVLLNLVMILGIVFCIILGVMAFVQHDSVLGTVDLSVSAFLIYLAIFLRKTKKYKLVSIIGTIVAGFFYFFLVASGGINNTACLWAFTYPLVSLFLLGTNLGTWMSMALLGMASIVFAFGARVDFFTSYSIDFIIRFIPVYIIVYAFAFVMEKVRETVQSQLESSNIGLQETVRELKEADAEKQRLIQRLEETINEIKTLRGILPMCANCKKIRNDKGYWEQVEQYIQNHSEAQFSHGICPECIKLLYPDFDFNEKDDSNTG